MLQIGLLDEDAFSVLPQVHTLEVITLGGWSGIFSILTVDLDIIEGSACDPGSEVDTHLLKIILIIQLHMVNLGGVLAEHEKRLLSGPQVLGITPLCIQVIRAIILALHMNEKDGLGLEGEGRDVAIIYSLVLAEIEDLL